MRGPGGRAKGKKQAKAAPAPPSPVATPAPPAAPPAADMFFQKGDASANSFRPFYWTYDRPDGAAPPSDAEPAPAAITPPQEVELPRRRSRRRKGRETAAEDPPLSPAPEAASPPEPPAAPVETEAAQSSRRYVARSVIRDLRARLKDAASEEAPAPTPETPPAADEPSDAPRRSARSLSRELRTRARAVEEPSREEPPDLGVPDESAAAPESEPEAVAQPDFAEQQPEPQEETPPEPPAPSVPPRTASARSVIRELRARAKSEAEAQAEPPSANDDADSDPVAAAVDTEPTIESAVTNAESFVEEAPGLAEVPPTESPVEAAAIPAEAPTPPVAWPSSRARAAIRELRARAKGEAEAQAEPPSAGDADGDPVAAAADIEVSTAPAVADAEPVLEEMAPPAEAPPTESLPVEIAGLPAEAPEPVEAAPSRARAAIRELRARARQKADEGSEETADRPAEAPSADETKPPLESHGLDAPDPTASPEDDFGPALGRAPPKTPAPALPEAAMPPRTLPPAAAEVSAPIVSESQRGARSVIQELRARARSPSAAEAEPPAPPAIIDPATVASAASEVPPPPLADPPPVSASQKAARSVIQELRSRSKGKSGDDGQETGEPAAPPVTPPAARAPGEKPALTRPGKVVAASDGKRDGARADASENRARSVIQEVRARAKTESEPKQAGLGAFFGRLFGKGSKRQENKRPKPETPSPQPPAAKPIHAGATPAPPLELSQRAAPAESQTPPTPAATQPKDRIGSVIAKLQAVKQREASGAPLEPTEEMTPLVAETIEPLELFTAQRVAEPAELELAAEEMVGDLVPQEMSCEAAGELATGEPEAGIAEPIAGDQSEPAAAELAPEIPEVAEGQTEAEAAHLEFAGDDQVLEPADLVPMAASAEGWAQDDAVADSAASDAAAADASIVETELAEAVPIAGHDDLAAALSGEAPSDAVTSLPDDASSEAMFGEADAASTVFAVEREVVASLEPEPAPEFAPEVVSDGPVAEYPAEMPVDGGAEVAASDAEAVTAPFMSEDDLVVPAEPEPAAAEFAHGVVSDELLSELLAEIPVDVGSDVVPGAGEVVTGPMSEDDLVVPVEPEAPAAEFAAELLAELPAEIHAHDEAVAGETEIPNEELAAEHDIVAPIAPAPAAELAPGVLAEELLSELPAEIPSDTDGDVAASEAEFAERSAQEENFAPVEPEPVASEFPAELLAEEFLSDPLEALPVAAADEVAASVSDAPADVTAEEDIVVPEPELGAASAEFVSEFPTEMPVEAPTSELEGAAAPYDVTPERAEPLAEILVDVDDAAVASEPEVAAAEEAVAAEVSPLAMSEELDPEPPAEIPVDSIGEALASEVEVATAEYEVASAPQAAEFAPGIFSEEPSAEASAEILLDAVASETEILAEKLAAQYDLAGPIEPEPAVAEFAPGVVAEESVSELPAEIPSDTGLDAVAGDAAVAKLTAEEEVFAPAAPQPDAGEFAGVVAEELVSDPLAARPVEVDDRAAASAADAGGYFTSEADVVLPELELGAAAFPLEPESESEEGVSESPTDAIGEVVASEAEAAAATYDLVAPERTEPPAEIAAEGNGDAVASEADVPIAEFAPEISERLAEAPDDAVGETAANEAVVSATEITDQVLELVSELVAEMPDDAVGDGETETAAAALAEEAEGPSATAPDQASGYVEAVAEATASEEETTVVAAEAPSEAPPEPHDERAAPLAIGELLRAERSASLDESSAGATPGESLELPAAFDAPVFGETSAAEPPSEIWSDLQPAAATAVPEWAIENAEPASQAVLELALDAAETLPTEAPQAVEARVDLELAAEPAMSGDADAQETQDIIVSREEIGRVEPETAVAQSLDVVATETAARVEAFEAGSDVPTLETAASLDPVAPEITPPLELADTENAAVLEASVASAEPPEAPTVESAAPEAEPVVVPSMFARLRAFAQSMRQRGETSEKAPSVDTPQSAAPAGIASAPVVAEEIAPEREAVVLESDASAEPFSEKNASLTPAPGVVPTGVVGAPLAAPPLSIAPEFASVLDLAAALSSEIATPAAPIETAPATPMPNAAAIESAAAAARTLLEAALLRVQSARRRRELIEPDLPGEAAPSPSPPPGGVLRQGDAERRAAAAAGPGASMLESVPLAAFVPRTGFQSPEDIANAAAAARALLETALDVASARPTLSAPPVNVPSAVLGGEAAPNRWETPPGQGSLPLEARPTATATLPSAHPAEWSRVAAAAPPRAAALSPDAAVAAPPVVANIGTETAALLAEDATLPDTLTASLAPPPPAQPALVASPSPRMPAGFAAQQPLLPPAFSGAVAPAPAGAPLPAAPAFDPSPAATAPLPPSPTVQPVLIAPSPPVPPFYGSGAPLPPQSVAPSAPPAAVLTPFPARVALAPAPFVPGSPAAGFWSPVDEPVRGRVVDIGEFPGEAGERLAPPLEASAALPAVAVPPVSLPVMGGGEEHRGFGALGAATGIAPPSSPAQGDARSALGDIHEAPQPAALSEPWAPVPAPAATEIAPPSFFSESAPNTFDDIREAPLAAEPDARFAPLPAPADIESVVPMSFGQGVPRALDDIHEAPLPAASDERFAPLPAPADIESVAPVSLGQGAANALDDIREAPLPAALDERFAPAPAPADIESVVPASIGQGVPNALADIRETPLPAQPDERFASPPPAAEETVAPASVPDTLDRVREEPLPPEVDDRFAPPPTETVGPASFRQGVPRALDDIREPSVEAETVALPSFPQGVPNTLDDIREPLFDEANAAGEPVEFVSLRSPVLSALDDIRESEREPSFASDDNVIAAQAEFARRAPFDDAAEEAGAAPPENGAEDGDALGEAIESVLASKWYGNGEAPGAPATQRAPSPAPPIARQITHDSLLAELYSARQADAPPPEPEPERRSSNRLLVIVCVVVGLLAAAGGAVVMTGAGGFFGTSSSAPRR